MARPSPSSRWRVAGTSVLLDPRDGEIELQMERDVGPER